MGDDDRALIDTLEREGERAAEKIENCRKFMILARGMMILGAGTFVGDLVGLARLPPAGALLGIAGVIAGIVIYGSHHSTRQEASERLRAIEAERSELIDGLDLRGVTLH